MLGLREIYQETRFSVSGTAVGSHVLIREWNDNEGKESRDGIPDIVPIYLFNAGKA